MTSALVLASLLALAAVIAVSLPFLREPEASGEADRLPGAGDGRRLALVEERDRALAALSELEFDHRTGKVSDSDYREAIGPLRARAAGALRALDPEPAPEAPEPIPAPTPYEPGTDTPPEPVELPAPDPENDSRPHVADDSHARVADGSPARVALTRDARPASS
ncbi:MAG: hypothetical protein ABR583_10955 [Gaiellaceae bacterium]